MWSGVSTSSGFAAVTSAHTEVSLVPKQLDAVVSEVQFKKENLWNGYSPTAVAVPGF